MYGSSSDRFHPLHVGGEVRGDVALVEPHALDEIHLHAEGLALFDGDDAVLADLVDRLGDHLTDLVVGRRDRGDLGDLILRVDFLGDFLDRCHGGVDGSLDALLQGHRVGAGGHVAQTFADHAPRQDRRGRGAVTGDVVGLLGDLFDQLGADLLVWILEVDLLGDRHPVVGDGGCAPLLLQHDVAALWSQGDAHSVGELVHASFQSRDEPARRMRSSSPLLVLHDEGICHSHSQCESASTLDRRVLIRQPAKWSWVCAMRDEPPETAHLSSRSRGRRAR